MNEFSLDLQGIEPLVADLDKALDLHPNLVEKGLKQCGTRFKAHVKKIVKGKVKEHTGNLTKGFWTSSVKGFREDMKIDFSAETKKKNPHWHLIENGHEIVAPLTRNGKKLNNGGKVKGFKPGIKIMPGACKSFEPIFSAELEKVRDQILKEAGLL